MRLLAGLNCVCACWQGCTAWAGREGGAGLYCLDRAVPPGRAVLPGQGCITCGRAQAVPHEGLLKAMLVACCPPYTHGPATHPCAGIWAAADAGGRGTGLQQHHAQAVGAAPPAAGAAPLPFPAAATVPLLATTDPAPAALRQLASQRSAQREAETGCGMRWLACMRAGTGRQRAGQCAGDSPPAACQAGEGALPGSWAG
jgi:hypothetical protein